MTVGDDLILWLWFYETALFTQLSTTRMPDNLTLQHKTRRSCMARLTESDSWKFSEHAQSSEATGGDLPRTPISVSWTARASIKLAAMCFPSSLVNSRIVVGRPKHLDAVSTCGTAGLLLQPVKAASWLLLLLIPETINMSKQYSRKPIDCEMLQFINRSKSIKNFNHMLYQFKNHFHPT